MIFKSLQTCVIGKISLKHWKGLHVQAGADLAPSIKSREAKEFLCLQHVGKSQRDALQARVSGGILLQKSLKNMCSEIHFRLY